MDTALNVKVPDTIVAGVDEVARVEMRSRSGAVRALLAAALEQRIAKHERAEREES